MAMKKSLITSEDKRYWDFVEKTAEQVASWPEWMRGSKDQVSTKSSSERHTRSSGEIIEGAIKKKR